MVDESKIEKETVESPNEAEDFQEEGQVPTGSTIVVDGVVYAVSLFWQPLQDPDDPIQEIRETASQEDGADLYCIRQSGTYQYGIAKTTEGHHEGQIAVAVSVADAFSDKSSFVGVFKVKEGWWFIAIRNDVILSEEDVLYLNEEDAKKAFYAMMAVPDWGRKVAPSEWGIEGTQEIALSQVLRNSSQVRLVRLSSALNKKVLIGMGIALFIVAILVVQFIMSLWSEDDLSREMRRPRRPVRPVAAVKPEVLIPMPWENMVYVPDTLKRCWDYVYQISAMTVPAWKMDRTVCTQGDVTIEWSNSWPTGGRIAWLRSSIQQYNLEAVTLNIKDSGKEAEGFVSFSDLRRLKSEPNRPLTEVKENLIDIFQAIGSTIRITEKEMNAGSKSKPKKINYLTFAFESDYNPLEWSTFFEKFKGLDLDKIEYRPKGNNKWKYEGRIYEK